MKKTYVLVIIILFVSVPAFADETRLGAPEDLPMQKEISANGLLNILIFTPVIIPLVESWIPENEKLKYLYENFTVSANSVKYIWKHPFN